jgi:ribose transport system substrate-binding protein
VANFGWGSFKLAPRIVDKIKAHQPLNFVYSISDAGQPVFSAAIQSGFTDGVAQASKTYGYPLSSRMIGPVGGGNQKQISQIQELLNSNQIDVLVFNAAQPGPFIDILNQVMAAGVPVWGTGGDSPQSHRVGFFALDEESAGKQAGTLAGQWAQQHNLSVTKAAVFTGDPSGPWAQSRMKGFIEGLQSVLPQVQFVNSVSNPRNTGFDSPTVYSDSKSFILGHPDVQMIFHTDQGVQMVGKAIADTGRTGKTWAVGFNLSPEILNLIKSNQILVTVGQNWHGQAATAADAAAAFLFKGQVIAGFHAATPYPVTPDTLPDALKTLAAGGA